MSLKVPKVATNISSDPHSPDPSDPLESLELAIRIALLIPPKPFFQKATNGSNTESTRSANCHFHCFDCCESTWQACAIRRSASSSACWAAHLELKRALQLNKPLRWIFFVASMHFEKKPNFANLFIESIWFNRRNRQEATYLDICSDVWARSEPRCLRL